MSNIRVKIKTESTDRSDIYKRVVQIFLNDKFIGNVESFYKNGILMIHPDAMYSLKIYEFYIAITANGMHSYGTNSVNEAIQWVVNTHNLWWGDKNLKESSNPKYTFFDEIQAITIVDWADEVKRTSVYSNGTLIGSVTHLYKDKSLILPPEWDNFYKVKTKYESDYMFFDSKAAAIKYIVEKNKEYGDLDIEEIDEELDFGSNKITIEHETEDLTHDPHINWQPGQADQRKRVCVYLGKFRLGFVVSYYKNGSLVMLSGRDSFYQAVTITGFAEFVDSNSKGVKYIIDYSKKILELIQKNNTQSTKEIDEQLDFNREQFIITHETEHLNKDYWDFLGYWSDTRKTIFVHRSDGFYLGEVKSYYKNGILVMWSAWDNYCKATTKDGDYKFVDSNTKGVKFIIDQYSMQKRLGENKNQPKPEVTIYVETVPTPEDIYAQMHKFVNIFFKGNKIGYVQYMLNKYNELQKFYKNPGDKGHYYCYFVTKTHGLEQLRNAYGYTNNLNEAIQEVIVKYKQAVVFEDEQISKTKNNVLLHEGYRMSGDDVLYQYHYDIEKIRKLSKKQEVVIVYEVIHSSRLDQEEIKVEIGRVTSFYDKKVLVTDFPMFQFLYNISPSYTDEIIIPKKPYIWEIKYGTDDKDRRIGQVDTLREGIDKIIKAYEKYTEEKNRPKNNPIQTETDEKQDSPHVTIEITHTDIPNSNHEIHEAALRYGHRVIGKITWQTFKDTRNVIDGYNSHSSKDFFPKTFETFSEACRHIVDRFLNFHLRNELHRKNKVQNEAISFGPNITLVTSCDGNYRLIEILYRGRVKAEIESFVTDTEVLIPDSFRGRAGNTYPYRLLLYPLTYPKQYRYFNSASAACKFAVREINYQFQKNQNKKSLEETGNELNLNNIRMYTQQEYFDDWNRDNYTKRVVLYNRDTGMLGKITGLYRNNVLVPTHYQGKPYKAETLYPRPNPAVPFFVDSIKEGVEKILKELTNSSVEQIKEARTFVDKEYSENEQGKKIKWTTRAREFQVNLNLRPLVREYILYYYGKLAGIARYVYQENHGELLSAYYKVFPVGMWFGGMPPSQYDTIDTNIVLSVKLDDRVPLPSPAQAIKMMIDRIESSGATKYNIIGTKSK